MGLERRQAAVGGRVDVVERALQDCIGVPAGWPEMGPVAAERVGGEVAVAFSAVEMGHLSAVAADRKIGAGTIARAIGPILAVEIHAGLQAEEAVVKMRATPACSRTDHTEGVALLHAVHPDDPTPAKIL